MSLPTSLDRLLSRAEEIRAMLDTADGAQFGQLSKELSTLEPIVAKVQAYNALEAARAEAETLLSDPEMRELAEAELQDTKQQLPVLEREIRLMLLPRDVADEKNAILRIRPAAGGDEAGIFAGELFRAYQKYAEGRRWRFTVLDYDENELGGIKGASAEIEGRGCSPA
jgi:peptide chain release factor 1